MPASVPWAASAVFPAAKLLFQQGCVISYLESLRNDVRKYGISVTTICPGFVRTPLVAKNPYKMPFILEPEEFAERAVKAILDKDSYRVIPWQMAGWHVS